MLEIKKFINNVLKFQRNSALTLTFVYILLSFSIIVPLLFVYGGKFLALNEYNNGVSISKILIGENEWNSFSENVDNTLSFNSKIEFNIADISETTPSEEVYYYINKSNTPLIEEEVLEIASYDPEDNDSWQPFENSVVINEEGFYIIYAKIVDSNDNVSYVNTDILVLNGYTEPSLIVGKNQSSYEGASFDITNKSSITLNIMYQKEDTQELTENYTHNLLSNILLPLGTKVTLIDQITNKTYEYQANDNEEVLNNYNLSCDEENTACIKIATYPLTLFKEVGTEEEKLFIESEYYDEVTSSINENWTVVMDLSGTTITENYANVNLYMELKDESGSSVRTTLSNELKSFNIYSMIEEDTSSAVIYLNTGYSGNEILLNSNSVSDITLNTGIRYKEIAELKITDTTYENNEMGIAIKLVDSANNTMGEDYLKNIIFKMDDVVYLPEKDKIVRIKLSDNVTDISSTLKIITYKNNINLEEGNYYIKIYNYISSDGNYYNNLENSVITIPVSVINDKSRAQHDFDVIMEDVNRIVQKADGTVNMNFKILVSGESEDFNIRVSLYKKNELTAYNQNYTLVDLSDHVSDTLTVCENDVYYVSSNPVKYIEPDNLYNSFNLNFITPNFEYNGYKLVFDLYDADIKMSTIEKYFIVK